MNIKPVGRDRGSTELAEVRARRLPWNLRTARRAVPTVLMCVLPALLAAAADAPNVRLQPFINAVEFPVHVTHDGTERLFVVEQRGRIRLVLNGQLQPQAYLDIRDRVFFGGECGLLCVAFHPNFQRNGRFFVNYTTKTDGLHTIVSEFQADPKATAASPATERVILKFRQPWANHNGGQILFGPDGKFYIGTGDGGLAGDPLDSGQHLDTLLGKILRIDVDPDAGASGYDIPPDNPFVGKPKARPEIWAYGLRNPWRFCFDRATGLMYAADVGQDKWEEIDVIEKGKNYGWNIMEGFHPFKNGRSTKDLVPPIKEYGHDLGLSVTGGHVYRGKRFPSLVGYYIYADYETGRLWGLKYDGSRVTADVQFQRTRCKISSFGEDLAGEIYVCDHLDGAVWRLVVAEPGPATGR